MTATVTGMGEQLSKGDICQLGAPHPIECCSQFWYTEVVTMPM